MTGVDVLMLLLGCVMEAIPILHNLETYPERTGRGGKPLIFNFLACVDPRSRIARIFTYFDQTGDSRGPS
jgi:hypothetical protein